ncbi:MULTISPECIES: muconate/chloromuconate family cycloisomerase [Cupriavidus]|jgi:muconate cycloisomerase|uniref:Muconate cycloisomerase n=1 Tax=Cupriavidus metallidurans TaxID=119219 RepID=A0A2L0XC64_9BURK|nr:MULTISPECIES: muconate/chloromuconate family cycloisomerase [Cupriavidus]AVA37700.1 muconate cycloisomerase [Cupriavidus metallidurans]ELA01179.1 muconate cycloisomerase [Cupriavidus sp. HMR-1]KWR86914.1 muconate cycloisomerase [Cupriavidus sp. SHE]MDE4922338.1 muconate/chloromuconate family cycloisomerase [Cupriavidus metallidurans]QBP12807.1 muconate cycloisomerase [Cupriavidus metallidurans]
MTATISSIEAILVDLPTIRAHQLAMATMQQQTLVIVRLRCSDGIEGIGEATTIGGLSYGDESPEGIKLTIDTYLAPALVGQDATNVHAAMARLNKVARGNRFAKSALESAMLDAQGKRLDVPLATLLGGAVRDTLPVLWTLASGDTARDIEEAERFLGERRHNTFKLKIGRRSVREDVAHVSAIKRALGDRARVTVDVNQAWNEADAATGIAMLEAAGIDLIEQPTPREQRTALARLAARFVVPIMADEAVTGPEDAMELARLGAADVFALKIAKSGGIFGMLRTAAVGDAAGIALYGGTMLEGSVGTIAAAHGFCTLPQLAWGTELFGPLLVKDDIVVERPVFKDFSLHLPQGPGLGLAIDEDKLAHYRRKSA